MKNKKRILIMLAMMLCCTNVYAASANCPLFGDPNTPGEIAYYLQEALTIMKYIGIILCVVLTIMDFVKSIMMDEKDNFKELTKKAFTRLIYVVVLFFLPVIITVLFEFLGLFGTCNIG